MYRKIIKVFLGSPGDLEAERKAAKAIVDEENANHANLQNYHIELVGWEDTVSQRRRAQDAINVDLDQCEYFVGLIWKKWGTPPGPEGHPYSSGFEEEYRRSVARHDKTGKPEISLLLKSIAKEDLIDVGKQLEKVLEFQEEINTEKKQYYQKFEDLRDFEQKFRATIAKFLRDQKKEDDELETSAPQKPDPAKKEAAERRISKSSTSIFDGDAHDFLDDFLVREDTTDAYSATEAARFRLLACTISHSGNDRLVLGTHDSNLIYRDLRNANLTEREKQGLLSAGLENLGSSTVPLWHWLFSQQFKPQYELPFRTFVGSDQRRRNTFKLLEKLSITPIEFDGPFDQKDIPELWFAEGNSDDLIVAALDYLGSVGDNGIEVDWPKLIGNPEANIARAAVRASARITLRYSVSEALQIVSQHESTDLGSGLAELLLANTQTIETDVLRRCLKNKTTSFLKGVASELSNREALTRPDAQLLCESIDADIRLIGVRALTKIGPALTLADARKLLVKPRKTNGLALLSSPLDRDHHGEEAFANYKVDVLSKQSFDDLQEIQNDESFYSTEAILAVYLGHFKKIKPRLDEDLVDGFENFLVERREPLIGTSAEPSASVFSFIRTELLQSAFEIFCSKATEADIETIRDVVDRHDINFSAEIANFLTKYGEWVDLVRLVKLSEKQKYGLGFSFLSIVDHSSDYQLAAKSILKLGSKRIADAWKLEMPVSVRVQLVIQMPNKLFSAFDNQSVIEMLFTESDSVREIVALKSVLCLTKTRLNGILNAYYEVEGGYYYNTIFWLDLGVSADRSTSLAVARIAIDEKSR